MVTGGTRGIGAAMAIALAEAGADVILIQRDESNLGTKQKIEAMGRKAWIYTCDLASDQDVSELTARVLRDGHDVSILVTCAGIQRRHPSHKFPKEDWDEVLQVNLSTVFTLCRDVGAHMLTRTPDAMGHRGSIINIASLVSFQGGLTVPAYAAAKGGVSQLTKALSNEWASQGVNVNAIAPGYVVTDMNEALINDKDRAASILARIPAGRWGTSEDFIGATIFLASKASLYVSGEILTVDGGWMGRLPDNVSLAEGALLEPLSVAIHGVRRSLLHVGGTALVLGAGAIELLTAAMLRVEGAGKIVIADIDQERVIFATQNEFADLGFAVPRNNGVTIEEKLAIGRETAKLAVTAGDIEGFDAVFECTGVEACVQTAIYATRPGGRVMLIGMGIPIQTLPVSAAALREVDIVGVFRYCQTYPYGISVLENKGNPEAEGLCRDLPALSKLITHRFVGLNSIPNAFEMAGKGIDSEGKQVLKVLIEMEEE
ncbi:uncharacterized protein CDV56_108162 [Aspergillus thermomutatus]|uniref:Alcohol dehydrogenase-like C-terminal domain-containing protein n=1 Tax=Aspergillus thermomutatus TaxID=41047 RepID=A0A397HHP6_ASPTH|nr:uncharacterized protein CDV56_108162 [Aspergillus thermomutatus]RHZ62467.1 hypothetical protein CDV56_108162 [Aspergillus thermomutatus]